MTQLVKINKGVTRFGLMDAGGHLVFHTPRHTPIANTGQLMDGRLVCREKRTREPEYKGCRLVKITYLD